MIWQINTISLIKKHIINIYGDIEALESLRDGIIGEWDKAYQEDLKESEEDVFNEWSGTVFIIYRIRKRYIEKNNRAD